MPRLVAVTPSATMIDRVARAFEQVHQPVPQQRIIFDNKDFHGVSAASVIRRADGAK